MVKSLFLKSFFILSLAMALFISSSIQSAHSQQVEEISSVEFIAALEDQKVLSSGQAREAERYLFEESLSLSLGDLSSLQRPPMLASPQALPALPIVLACVGTVGLSAYKAYKGGDPIEYIAETILGCMPFGFAAKPAVVGLIKQFKPEIVKALKTLGATFLATVLDRTPAY